MSVARSRTLPGVIAVALLILVTAACSGTAIGAQPTGAPKVQPPPATAPGGGSNSDPGSAVGGTPGPAQPVDPIDDGWTLIKPAKGLQDVRKQAWDHISIAPDGKTVTVYFWGGVTPCYGLSDVKAAVANGVLTVTLLTGTPAHGKDVACIEIAKAYKAVVTLDKPLVRDGAATD
jgi:hypothetical protein